MSKKLKQKRKEIVARNIVFQFALEIMRKFVLSKKLRRRLKRGQPQHTYHLCMKERGKGRKWKTESKMGREKNALYYLFLHVSKSNNFFQFEF